MGIIIFLSDKFDDYNDKKKRIRLLKEFKKQDTYSYVRIDDPIFDRYIKNDYYELEQMHYLLKDEEKLNINYAKSKEELKNKKFRRVENGRNMVHYTIDLRFINLMTTDGILFKEGERLIINQPMKDTIDKLIEFLKSKNIFRAKNSLRFRSNFYYEDEI